MKIHWEEYAKWWIPGNPIAQPRHNESIRENKQGKSYIHRYTPDKKVKPWRELICLHGRKHIPRVPLDEPVCVDVYFYLPRPKKLMGKKYRNGPIPHTAKPDRDNLDKAVLDALKKDGWFRDDSIVCDGRILKVYHAKDGKPGLLTVVSTLETEEQATLY